MIRVARILRANEITHGGGWFLPNGEVLRLQNSTHARVARIYLMKHGEPLEITADNYEPVFAKGWIRFWFDGQGVCIQTSAANWNAKSIHKIQIYLMEHPETISGKPEVYIEVGKVIFTDRDTFLTANKPNDLLRNNKQRVARVGAQLEL